VGVLTQIHGRRFDRRTLAFQLALQGPRTLFLLQEVRNLTKAFLG
ncbi:unnamed protein product, partial [Acidocella sp. C78]